MNEMIKHFIAAYVTTLLFTIAVYNTTGGFGLKVESAAPAAMLMAGSVTQ